MLYKDGIPLTKTAQDFLCCVFARSAAGLRMLRMFAGSVVDPALIVSALRGVVCQDAPEAALACVADKYPRISGVRSSVVRTDASFESIAMRKPIHHLPQAEKPPSHSATPELRQLLFS
jgi:hypothetical protein